MTSLTRNDIDGDAVEAFQRDGYTIFRDVIDAELIKEVNGHVEWLQARHPEVRPEQLGHVYLKDDPFWVRLVSDPRLLRIAEQFVGPDLALFASHYISKPAYSGQAASGTRTPHSGRSTR